jgi:Ca-activated chloride channel family protein
MLFALLAIPLLVLLYGQLVRWKKRTARLIGDKELVDALTQDYSKKKFAKKFMLAIVTIAMLALAAAGIRTPDATATVKRNGIDVMIAIDVSKSMLASDVKPNRLDRAKQLIGKLIDGLQNDRVGIVVFAGKAYLQMPLTADHAAAKLFLSAISTDMVATQGTVIGEALNMCYLAFNSKQKKYKSIVLISDGEDHDGEAIKTAKALADEGIMICTVGIGSVTGSTITDPVSGDVKKDAVGGAVITRLNETLLQEIATTANGMYQLFTNTNETAKCLQTQLAKMEKRPVTDQVNAVYRHYFQWLVATALLLLIVEFLMSERKAKARQGKLALPIMLISMLMHHGLYAQSAEEQIAKGNKAYKERQYKMAVAAYEKAAADKKNAKALFNLGNALYKNKEPQKAVAAFDAAAAATTLPIQQSKAFYNKGVVLQNDNQLPACIAAYKQALRLNPNDEDARFNLQQALQQQKKQQQNDKKNNPNQQQQNKQQPKPQPSKMSQQEAMEKLKALLEQEKMLQDKLRKNNDASPNRPEKDW